MPEYGDLTDAAVMSQLIDGVCRLVEHNPLPWARGYFLKRDGVGKSDFAISPTCATISQNQYNINFLANLTLARGKYAN